jgi:hypothetical protein
MTKRIIVAAYQKPDAKRGRIFFGLSCLRRRAIRKKIARKLLPPAMRTGCQSTSLIKSPDVLHKTAHKRIESWPENFDGFLRMNVTLI